jgi:hypothetical protein
MVFWQVHVSVWSLHFAQDVASLPRPTEEVKKDQQDLEGV